ncbi:MAG: hypothetical protein HYZ28_27660 [Myxococcales bacterium]|nr:hypothetical protein [Myxococcales bacterium]
MGGAVVHAREKGEHRPPEAIMRVGIDWVSAGIFIGAFAFAQVRAIPIGIRYGVLAAACGAIAIYRLRIGASGVNMIFVVVAGALALYYAVRALRSGNRREPD